MLVRLLPEQVSQGWELWAPMISESLPPQIALSRTVLTNVLAAVLREEAQAWIYQLSEKETAAFLITTVVRDPIACTNTLLVYNLFLLKQVGINVWKDCIASLKEAGNVWGCSSVVAYHNRGEQYSRFLSMVGADVSTTLAVF